MKISKFFKNIAFLSLLSAVVFSILSFKINDDKTIVVSKDGKGDFTTIQQAVNSVEEGKTMRTKIIVKPGTYREKITIPATKSAISLIGENAENTILVYGDFASKQNQEGKNIGTTGSSSIFIFSDDFSAKNITFQNDAGPVGQAVAVLTTGDRLSFENCRFLGFQDTLYTKGTQDNPDKSKPSRNYFKNCYIEGTTDYIFGAGTAVFENCTIYSKKNASYVTAASTPEGSEFGYVFINCKITGDADSNSVYLGRPWRPFARTVYMNCAIDSTIKPEGWHNWGKADAEQTTFYGEYNSKGLGGDSSKRVSWSHQLTKKESKKYTAKNILKGNDNWNLK
ncbi:pectinesterase family protein [Epilithonimonas ginsengisoli]|uniref:Pectinesterase n=1 Tax=Epilithonimonas ginsengisoli TaxID=1245592 RepID=A0ABU4JF71_9FLAO|nr:MULTISPECIES: pectinesterase family protein [Chryseobacterium group]MBV6879685.1 pectin esterase [Epilithonimonas sp. FP105]MDW8548324.1 pectinesterase family protein [Epilithonimonas ginsengisoli]OAH72558.1 pectin esterase [Chryseobacterium sp. FP211-J200]